MDSRQFFSFKETFFSIITNKIIVTPLNSSGKLFLGSRYKKIIFIEDTKIKKPNASGKYDFHINCIKESNLNLGNEALTHTKVKTKKVVLRAKFICGGINDKNSVNGNQPPKNNKAVIKDIIII